MTIEPALVPFAEDEGDNPLAQALMPRDPAPVVSTSPEFDVSALSPRAYMPKADTPPVLISAPASLVAAAGPNLLKAERPSERYSSSCYRK